MNFMAHEITNEIVDGTFGQSTDGEQLRWRPFTIPNGITFVRLLCVPVFVWLLFGADNRAAAAILLAVLGSTDWVDGWFARKFDQVSEFGKLFDPSADRLMMLTVVIATWIDGSVPWWFALLTLSREGLVTLVAIGLGVVGADRFDVSWWGKTGTFFLMFAYPLLLGGASGVEGAEILRILGWVCGIPGLFISWYAAFEYGPIARTALRNALEKSPAV